jgi:hypothetical protein
MVVGLVLVDKLAYFHYYLEQINRKEVFMGIIACLSGLHEWGVKKRRLNGEIKEIKVCTN